MQLAGAHRSADNLKLYALHIARVVRKKIFFWKPLGHATNALDPLRDLVIPQWQLQHALLNLANKNRTRLRQIFGRTTGCVEHYFVECFLLGFLNGPKRVIPACHMRRDKSLWTGFFKPFLLNWRDHRKQLRGGIAGILARLKRDHKSSVLHHGVAVNQRFAATRRQHMRPLRIGLPHNMIRVAGHN